MLGDLASAVEDLELCPNGDVLAEALALADRLEAKIAVAFGAFDAAGAWRDDGIVSGVAWLRSRGQRSARNAARFATLARRLDQLPVCAAAGAEGTLSGGQLEAVVAVLDDSCVALFAEHEAELVPRLSPLTVRGVARAMSSWKAHAAADGTRPKLAERSLHLSPTLGGRVELSGSLDAESGSVVQAAVRLASTADTEGEPERLPPTRRADALVDICRYFLDHSAAKASTRHRPHLNVVVDLEDLGDGGGGRLVDGPALDAAALATLACDSVIHRVVFSGRSAVLDYGTGTRTIPVPLWNALVVRDEHCRFPGCDRPPNWCEAHHVVWFSAGGPTAIDNLALVCSRHHHLLHLPLWQAKLRPDATLEVTDPRGRVRTTAPPRAGPRLW